MCALVVLVDPAVVVEILFLDLVAVEHPVPLNLFLVLRVLAKVMNVLVDPVNRVLMAMEKVETESPLMVKAAAHGAFGMAVMNDAR